MKYILKIICIYFGLISVLLLNSCNDILNYEVDCDQCYSLKPDSGELHLKITINQENPRVPIVIYKDKVEEQVVEWTDTATTSDFYLLVKLNKRYSATAQYKSGNKTIFAIDGAKVGIRKVSDVCETDCWVFTKGIIDLRLK